MSKRWVVLLVIGCILMQVTAAAQEPLAETYSNDLLELHFRYPAGWVVAEQEGQNYLYLVNRPEMLSDSYLEPGSGDVFVTFGVEMYEYGFEMEQSNRSLLEIIADPDYAFAGEYAILTKPPVAIDHVLMEVVQGIYDDPSGETMMFAMRDERGWLFIYIRAFPGELKPQEETLLAIVRSAYIGNLPEVTNIHRVQLGAVNIAIHYPVDWLVTHETHENGREVIFATRNHMYYADASTEYLSGDFRMSMTFLPYEEIGGDASVSVLEFAALYQDSMLESGSEPAPTSIMAPVPMQFTYAPDAAWMKFQAEELGTSVVLIKTQTGLIGIFATGLAEEMDQHNRTLYAMLETLEFTSSETTSLPDKPTTGAEGCVPITSTVTVDAFSSEFDEHYLAANLIDDDLNTGWSPAAGDSLPYVALTINPPVTIVGMQMETASTADGLETDATRDFYLFSRWADGEWGAFWTEFYNATAANTPGVQEYRFDPFFTGEVMLEFRSNDSGDFFEAREVIFCQAFND